MDGVLSIEATLRFSSDLHTILKQFPKEVTVLFCFLASASQISGKLMTYQRFYLRSKDPPWID